MTKITNADAGLEDHDVIVLAKARGILLQLPAVLHTEHTMTMVGQTFHTASAVHVIEAVLAHNEALVDEVRADTPETEHIVESGEPELEEALANVQTALGLLVEQTQVLARRVMNP